MSNLKYCLTLLIITLIFVATCQPGSNTLVESYTVRRGDFLVSVTETGELEALNSNMINCPPVSFQLLTTLKITKIVEDGKQVEKDEVIIEFDKSEVEKTIEDAKAELEIARAELRKAQANHQSKLEELTADLDIAKLDHRISNLNLQLMSYEAEIDRKKIELDLEKATISLEKAQQEIENQKSINHEEISILELKVQQVKNKLEEAEKTLTMLTVTAPAPGIAIVQRSPYTGEKYTIDDQAYPFRSLIGLPDLSLMKANIQINEVDIAKIDTSQKAIIRLDAFPDTSFYGHVSEIATLARTKDRESKVKVFDVSIIMDENDEKLMPGMTVSCEIIVDNISDTIFIPLEALFNKDGNNIVYLQKGGGFESRIVKVGPENDNFVIIIEGLKEGDAVALTEPSEIQT